MASSLCASCTNNLRTKGRALSGLLRCHCKALLSNLPALFSPS